MERTHLKEWRIKAGLTQKEVASKLGIDTGHYNRIEKGIWKNLHSSTVERLMRVTKLPYPKIDAFLKG